MTQDSARRTASYVYGIVPSDVEGNPEARGIGEPPSPVAVVRHGDIAALVSPLPMDSRPLGEPEDLIAHESVLDSVVGEVPVLPLRFGAVLATQDAVVEELLGAHHDEFADALRRLEGHAEYLLKGRYDERAMLTEVLSESQDAVRLHEAIRTRPADASRNERIALGELITNAIAAKRDADTRQVVEALGRLDAMISVREPTHEQDAVKVAVLLESARERELERLAHQLADSWSGRVELSLLGPLAPYDFVAAGG
jgi:hypothetical protein